MKFRSEKYIVVDKAYDNLEPCQHLFGANCVKENILGVKNQGEGLYEERNAKLQSVFTLDTFRQYLTRWDRGETMETREIVKQV